MRLSPTAALFPCECRCRPFHVLASGHILAVYNDPKKAGAFGAAAKQRRRRCLLASRLALAAPLWKTLCAAAPSPAPAGCQPVTEAARCCGRVLCPSQAPPWPSSTRPASRFGSSPPLTPPSAPQGSPCMRWGWRLAKWGWKRGGYGLPACLRCHPANFAERRLLLRPPSHRPAARCGWPPQWAAPWRLAPSRCWRRRGWRGWRAAAPPTGRWSSPPRPSRCVWGQKRLPKARRAVRCAPAAPCLGSVLRRKLPLEASRRRLLNWQALSSGHKLPACDACTALAVPQVDPGYLSEPVAVEFATEGGLTAFMNYYAPRNKARPGLRLSLPARCGSGSVQGKSRWRWQLSPVYTLPAGLSIPLSPLPTQQH